MTILDALTRMNAAGAPYVVHLGRSHLRLGHTSGSVRTQRLSRREDRPASGAVTSSSSDTTSFARGSGVSDRTSLKPPLNRSLQAPLNPSINPKGIS